MKSNIAMTLTPLQSVRVILADDVGFVRVMYPLLPNLNGGQAHRINSVSRYSVPVTAMCYGETEETVILAYQDGKVEIYHIPLKFTAYCNNTYKFDEPRLITYTNISAVVNIEERHVHKDTAEDKDQALRQRISPREIRVIAFTKPNNLVMITSNSKVHRFTLENDENGRPSISFLSSFQMNVNIRGPRPLPAPTLGDFVQTEPPPELRNASSEAYILIPVGSKIYAACGGWGHAPRIYDSATGDLVYVPRNPPPSFPARADLRFIATCFCYDLEDGIFVVGDMDGWIHCYKTGLWGPTVSIAERPENISGWNEPEELKKRKGRSIQSVSELIPHNMVDEAHKNPYQLSKGIISSAALWYNRNFERKVCAVSIVTVCLDDGIGKYLCASNGEGTCDLLSLESGKLCRRFNKHGGAVKSFASLRLNDASAAHREQSFSRKLQKVNDKHSSDSESVDSTESSLSSDTSDDHATTIERKSAAVVFRNSATAHKDMKTTDTLIFTGCLDKFLRVYTPGSREPVCSHYVVNSPLVLLASFAKMRYKRALEEQTNEYEENTTSESESFDDETKRPADLPEDSIDEIDLDLNIAVSAPQIDSTKKGVKK